VLSSTSNAADRFDALRRALDDRLYLIRPVEPLAEGRSGASITNQSDKRARSTVRGSGETRHAKLNNRLTGTKPKEVDVAGDQPILPDFHPPERAAGGHSS